MKRHVLTTAALLCLLVAMCGSAAAKDSWTGVRSKNFLVVGNASESEIRQVATRLEQFRDVFSRVFSRANLTAPIPMTVIVFKSDSAYKPFKPLYQGKPANVAGYFQRGDDVNYITLTTERGGSESPFSVIFHEYTHLLVDNNMDSPPLWFNEGLAEYYSTFSVESGDKKADIGKPIENHLIRLQESFLPLRAVLAVDPRSPLYNERNKQSIFYAESWALMHYLIQGNKHERLPQLGDYLKRLAAGEKMETAFSEAFKTDYDGMEKELRTYVKRNSYPFEVVTFKEKLEFDREMTAAPVTDAQAQFYLGDLLLHINRVEDGAARLRQAIEIDPTLSAAHASLGVALMRQNKIAEAKEHLQKAVEGGSQNYLTHYYYAYALTHEGMNGNQMVMSFTPEQADAIRNELHKSIALNSNFPGSFELLAFVNMVMDQQLYASIGLIRRAMTLAPARHDYAMVLAEIYMRMRDFESARKTLDPLANGDSTRIDPSLRAAAQHLLDSIGSMEQQEARYAARRAERLRAGSQDSAAGSVTSATSSNTELETVPLPKDPRERERTMLQQALRRPAEGELRVRGMLQRIDCDNSGSTAYVKVGDKTFRLHNSDFTSVDFSSYVPDMKGEISCGPRNPASNVVVTYRPQKKGASAADGELIAVEFVPQDFELKP